MSSKTLQAVKKLNRKLNSLMKSDLLDIETEVQQLDVEKETLLRFKLNKRVKGENMLERRLYDIRNKKDKEELEKYKDKVYTLIEEDGQQFLEKGFKIVNRLGYLILK